MCCDSCSWLQRTLIFCILILDVSRPDRELIGAACVQGPDGNGDASGFAQLSSSIDSLTDRIEMQRLQEIRDYSALPEECRGSVQRMPHWMAQSIDRFVETVATKAVLANSLLVLWRISEGSQTNWMFLIHCSTVLGLVLYYNQSLERLQTAQFYDDDRIRLVGFYSLTYSLQLLVLLPTWSICM